MSVGLLINVRAVRQMLDLGLVKMKCFMYVTGVSIANTVKMEKVKIQV